MHIKSIVFALLVSASTLAETSDTLSTSDIDSIVSRLSLAQKIGQLLQIRFTGDQSTSSLDLKIIEEQIERYHIGSLTLGARMAGPNLIKGSPEQVAGIINQLQLSSDLPLLVGADIERGVASRLADVPDFPFPMAFGAAHDEVAAERWGRITAIEARAVGINWAYAPVADLNSNPRNPIINTRSFGEDPEATSRLVAAFIRGAHSGGLRRGMLVAVKHFPGEGDTSTDPHAKVTRIDASRAHLNTTELIPFQAAIKAGADSVMLAQASVPAVDPDTGHVAATSGKVVEGLLRQDLGFPGIVLTDALEMRGLTQLYPGISDPSGEIAVDAIKAGDDVLMLPSNLDAAFKALEAAVRSGVIPESRIDASVKRILTAKQALGLFESRTVDLQQVKATFGDKGADRFAQEISDEAVTLIRSSGRLLPMAIPGTTPANKPPGAPKVTVVITFTDSARSRLGQTFGRELLAHDPHVKIFHFYNDLVNSDAGPSTFAYLQDADIVILAPFLTHIAPRQLPRGSNLVNAVGFSGPGAQLFNDLLAAAPDKTVVVALGSPYLIETFPSIQNYICTYSLASTAEVSAVRALYGEIRNHATLPVTLPGAAERGTSIPWPAPKTAQVHSH